MDPFTPGGVRAEPTGPRPDPYAIPARQF